jgi:hypothetical protein
MGSLNFDFVVIGDGAVGFSGEPAAAAFYDDMFRAISRTTR